MIGKRDSLYSWNNYIVFCKRLNYKDQGRLLTLLGESAFPGALIVLEDLCGVA